MKTRLVVPLLPSTMDGLLMVSVGTTVTVALVASRLAGEPLANHRAWHVVPIPADGGTGNVTVALVTPVSGGVFVLFRKL